MKYLLSLMILLSTSSMAQEAIKSKKPSRTRKILRRIVVDEKTIEEYEEIVLTDPREYGVILKESQVGFSIEKFKIGKAVPGEFKTFNGEAKLDNATLYYLKGRVLVDSIDTDDDKRDTHLKSGDFFAANNYPHIDFRISRKIEFSEKIEFETKGYLTIKGRRKPVKLEMLVMPGRKGRYIIEGKTTINRYDFGVNWNKRMDKQERSLFETLKDFAQGIGDKYILDKDVDINFRLTLLPMG